MSTLKTKPPSLEERIAVLSKEIERLQSEANAIIDETAEGMQKQDAPLVPVPVLRNIICNRSHGCVCSVVLRLQEQG
jgi:hypothetical protein